MLVYLAVISLVRRIEWLIDVSVVSAPTKCQGHYMCLVKFVQQMILYVSLSFLPIVEYVFPDRFVHFPYVHTTNWSHSLRAPNQYWLTVLQRLILKSLCDLYLNMLDICCAHG